MKLKIIATTDNKNLGFEFTDKFPITLPSGSLFSPDSRTTVKLNIYRLSTSNYVIDCEKI